MAEESENDRYLDYELEYICRGNASDAQNLEETVRRILLLREGVNYGYLLTDEEAKAKAELLAVALAAVTGNEALVKGVKHLILLGWGLWRKPGGGPTASERTGSGSYKNKRGLAGSTVRNYCAYGEPGRL